MPWRLLWIREEWDSRSRSDLMDSYGQEWVSKGGTAAKSTLFPKVVPFV